MRFKRVLFVVSLGLILSTCTMFQDFLAPSDLVNAVEKRDGVQIESISTTPNDVINNGMDTFTIECVVKSQYDVTNVVVNLGSIKMGIKAMATKNMS